MKKFLLPVFICGLVSYCCNAQDMKYFEIKPKVEPGISVQTECTNFGDAVIIVISNIDSLNFSSEDINETRHSGNKYYLCVNPGVKINIRISHSGYDDFVFETPLPLASKDRVQYIVVPKQTVEAWGDEHIPEGEFKITTVPDSAKLEMKGNTDFNAAKHVSPYTFAKGYLTGHFQISVSKENFRDTTIDININPNRPGKAYVVLSPKMGYLSVKCNNDGIGAEVLIDEQKVGTLPLSRLPLMQGLHSLIIRKAGFGNINVPTMYIAGNQSKDTIVNVIRTKILTINCNESRAKITVDGNYIGKTNKKGFTCNLQLGQHTVEISKDNFGMQRSTINLTATAEPAALTFELKEDLHLLTVNVKPNAEVYLDGTYQGQSPLQLQTTKGYHIIKLKRRDYFTNNVHKKIAANDKNKLHKTLVGKYQMNLNVLYGYNTGGIELGFLISHFSFAIDVLLKPTSTNYSDVIDRNTAFDLEADKMRLTTKKYCIIDSIKTGWAIKAGFALMKPFPVRYHFGLLYRRYRYNDIYAATKTFTYNSSTTSGTVYPGDYIHGNEIKSESFISYMAGVEVLLFRHLNLQADYCLNEEGSSAYVVGIGCNFSLGSGKFSDYAATQTKSSRKYKLPRLKY